MSSSDEDKYYSDVDCVANDDDLPLTLPFSQCIFSDESRESDDSALPITDLIWGRLCPHDARFPFKGECMIIYLIKYFFTRGCFLPKLYDFVL